MRNRAAFLAAGMAFAVLLGGLAALAGKTGGPGSGRDLPRLPFAASAGEARATAGMAADRAIASYPAGGGIEYRIVGALPDLGGHAPAFRLPPVDEAEVAPLARALGLPAPPKHEDGAWTVADGMHFLRVDAATGQWNYGADPGTAVSSGSVAPSGSVDPSGGVASSGSGSAVTACAPCPPNAMCAQVCKEPTRPAGLPTKDEAEQAARALWSKLGIDPGRATVQVDDNFSEWFVHFQPRVAGVEVQGTDVGVSVGVKGAVQSVAGGLGLARPERLGDYPLISLAAAVDRLNHPVAIGPACRKSDPPQCAVPEPMPAQRDRVCMGNAGAPTTFAPAAGCAASDTPLTTSGSAGAGSANGSAGAGSSGAGSAGKPSSTGGAGAGGVGGGPDSGGPVTTETAPPPLPPGPIVLTITGARLALQLVDGHLVPVYAFTLSQGGEITVPAVPDRLLQR
jgi:hypothetical protein